MAGNRDGTTHDGARAVACQIQTAIRPAQARRRPGLLAMDTTMTESAYPSVDVVDAKDLDRTLL